MRAYEAITEANGISPNQYGNDLKLRWLHDLEGRIYHELMERREAPAPVSPWPSPFDTGDGNRPPVIEPPEEKTESCAETAFDDESILRVPEPWARDVYVNYLLSRVAQADAEAERYNLYASLFNSAYGEYAAWYNRTARLPRRGGWRY